MTKKVEDIVDEISEKVTSEIVSPVTDDSEETIGVYCSEMKKFYSPWDACTPPPKVENWKFNEVRVDALDYIPIDLQIKRMLVDGQRLADYRHTAEYKEIFDKIRSEDFSQPVDDLLYLSKPELLARAQELQASLDEYRSQKAAAASGEQSVSGDAVTTAPQSSAEGGSGSAADSSTTATQ